MAKSNIRTIEITHDEIEIIKNALQYAYDKNLELVRNHKKILGEDASKKVLEIANKFFDAQDIFSGDRDV